ncbi:TniQ family protein [Streptomyces sp. NBC_00893]|uniref:TniQ family protein n=1 Tax=Streptomyces sp. NBC_00893 TaxID=2975862 RepID=UPI002253DBB4|nr:TniQ family protein [Streptomyces sp. NBC_00893]MCX4850397.1 TniQ family protein [Streptomyces sp. NBC_00893]
MHPLPRSLEPVSGESLVSYLLRLGHRLGLSPLHLICAAGWTGHHYVPGSLLLDLSGPQAEAFARLTRQTADEVSALTLAQWRDRYPPITRSMPGPGGLLTSALQGEVGVSRVRPVPAMKPSRVSGRY